MSFENVVPERSLRRAESTSRTLSSIPNICFEFFAFTANLTWRASSQLPQSRIGLIGAGKTQHPLLPRNCRANRSASRGSAVCGTDRNVIQEVPVRDTQDVPEGKQAALSRSDRHPNRQLRSIYTPHPSPRQSSAVPLICDRPRDYRLGRSVTAFPPLPGNAAFAPPAFSPANSASKLGYA